MGTATAQGTLEITIKADRVSQDRQVGQARQDSIIELKDMKNTDIADEVNTAKLGTVKNPIMIEGKPFAYNRRGKLVMIEDFDPNTMEKFTLTRDMKLSAEQVAALKEAKKRPQVYDEDCPPSTDEFLAGMKRFWPRQAETV